MNNCTYSKKYNTYVHKNSEAFKLLEAGKMDEFHKHMKRLRAEAIKRGEFDE